MELTSIATSDVARSAGANGIDAPRGTQEGADLLTSNFESVARRSDQERVSRQESARLAKLN
jgi:hypothetical protein